MLPRKPRRKSAKPRKSPKQPKSHSKGEFLSPVGRDFERLVAVMARLRAADGCPWDREQTHATLRTYLIEEAYEVLDALDSSDDPKFAEELGDLLLQVLFHAQIAREEHRFSITDVIREIHDKMVRRHPHVFGATTAKTAADVLRNWEIIKKQERAARSPAQAAAGLERRPGESRSPSASPSSRAESYLDGVPRTLPALLEALQLTRKAARIGFDWPDVNGIFAKLTEETLELQAVLSARGAFPRGTLAQTVAAGLPISEGELTRSPESRAPATQGKSSRRAASPSQRKMRSSERSEPEQSSSRIESELGDMLFAAVNLARYLHVDPELALKKTSAKFTRRFHCMEQFAREQGVTLAEIPREQLESFWDRAKLSEKLE